MHPTIHRLGIGGLFAAAIAGVTVNVLAASGDLPAAPVASAPAARVVHVARATPSDTLAASSDTGLNPFIALDLTVEQQAQLRALTLRSRGARAEILARQASGGRISAEARDALARIAGAHNEAVRALLTDAQRAQFDARVSRALVRLRAHSNTSPSAPGAGAR
jgi:Spy/CpxP family protein refolding chaperone